MPRNALFCFVYSLILTILNTTAIAASPTGTASFSWKSLQYQPLHTQDAENYSLTETSMQAQFDTGQSTYLAFTLPADVSALTLHIKSLLQDSVFYPDIVILNAQFETIQHLRSPDVHYSPAKLLNKAGIVAQLNLNLSQPIQYRPAYIVLFTTAMQLTQHTEIPSDYDAYAAARGNIGTGAKPRLIPHSLYGEIRIQRQQQKSSEIATLQIPNITTKKAPQSTSAITYSESAISEALLNLYRVQVQQQLEQGDLAGAQRSIHSLQQLLDQLRKQVEYTQ